MHFPPFKKKKATVYFLTTAFALLSLCSLILAERFSQVYFNETQNKYKYECVVCTVKSSVNEMESGSRCSFFMGLN